MDFEVESYLRYRGSQFVNRFDANSYLFISKAMDYFDLTNGRSSMTAALQPARARFRFPPLTPAADFASVC